MMGKATEELAARSGPGIGGLLNVTFGNFPELVIAFFALLEGLQEVVKASIIGSIIGNILLVLGAAMLVGGLGREKQTFNQTAAQRPVGDATARAGGARHAGGVRAGRRRAACRARWRSDVNYGSKVEHLSLAVAIVLILSYVAGLVFSLKTHRDLFNPDYEEEAAGWSVRRGVITLAVAGVLVGVMSEVLVGSIAEAAESIGLSEFFIGAIVVAIVGNAAEHWVAVLVAAKNKMDLAVNIAIGSSTQIALFVAPAAGAAVVPVRRPPDGARVQRLRAGGGDPGDPDRQPRHERGRVELVRGTSSCWPST